jgi:cyclase
LVDGVREGHASAVLAASIFHFGQHSIADAHTALRAAGLPARA